EAPIRSAALAPEGPRGVGGWLLLLCVGMAVVGPLCGLLGVSGLVRAALHPDLIGSMRVYFVCCAAIFGLTAAAVTYGGVRLWNLEKGAPRLAQWALLSIPIGLAGTALLPLGLSVPSGVAGLLVKTSLLECVKSIPGTALWYVYLDQSRRVRATFGE